MHEVGGQSLDGVGAGFIQRLAAGHVFEDLVGGERCEPDARLRPVDGYFAAASQADPGDHFVAAIGEKAQHALGVGGIDGLEQHLAVDHDHGIGAQHDVVGAGGDGARLGLSDAPGVVFGLLAVVWGFVHIGG